MSDSETIDPRRRIRELLAIPDRDRTDAEWDELNELEIRTAPGNRESAGDRATEKRANHAAQPRRTERGTAAKNNGGQRGEARAPDARGEGRPAAKRQHRRPKRSGGQGGASGQGGQGGTGGDTPGNS